MCVLGCMNVYISICMYIVYTIVYMLMCVKLILLQLIMLLFGSRSA